MYSKAGGNLAELNLNQITNRLNAEFMGETRKLVFWYDDKAGFAEDISTMELENAKILVLEPHNQFQTKYLLERQDQTTNYLIYAPFPKPDVRDNHLEDTLLYSKRFFADRTSLLCADLGIRDKDKHVIEEHIKFFANKERTNRFYALEIENFNEENILTGIMSAVCRARTCSFDEVVRVLLTEDGFEDNKFLVEFDKYNLLSSFWKFCEQQFGYSDGKPSLEKLVITMFVTYAKKYIQEPLPKSWQPFASYKSGNIIAFLDGLMNNYLYRKQYNKLSAHVAASLDAASALKAFAPEALVECDAFADIDKLILGWITKQLLNENIGAKLGDRSIPAVCDVRRKMHFGTKFNTEYELLSSAFRVISVANYTCPDGFAEVITWYRSVDYTIDAAYRHFYTCYDRMENTGAYESLRDLVENIYTNEYLGKQLPKWNAGMLETGALSALPLQRNFFTNHIENSKERTVVIISDAMRYEVGAQLFNIMRDDPKCTARLDCMLSTLPSYTRLGMAALLPHRKLELTDDGKELIDGVYCNDLASRQTALQSALPDSCCVQFDDIKNMKKADLRAIFTGKQAVYVYHDQIDVRGEHSEDEVFTACEEAVTEIAELIRKLAVNANTLHFIVTADHGFLYKRDKFSESDKIGGISEKSAILKRRYIVSEQPVHEIGVCSLPLGHLLGNEDHKIVSFPSGVCVFKAPGGGQNYVHGGSSPQEMLVPVIDIKMEKGHMETRNVKITLVSLVQKITNLVTSLDFIQAEPISDVIRSTTFRVYFISEDNEKISNENIYVADNRDENAQKRIFRMRFTFKNKKYDGSKQSYLVAYDDNSSLEVFRHTVIMDLAFVDDFGFGL